MSSSDFRAKPLDARGNFVAQDGTLDHRAMVAFAGRNNRLVIDGDVKLDRATFRFHGDNAQVVIGAVEPGAHLSLDISVGDGASVEIGAGVSSEKTAAITVADGAHVAIGAGTHLGTNVTVVADDSRGLGRLQGEGRHNVTIGQHVWLVRGTEVRAGAHIGHGAVLELVPLVDEELAGGQLYRGLPAQAVRPVTWNQDSLAAAR